MTKYSDKDWETVRASDEGGTSADWNIANLMNGTEYTVRVRAYSYTVPGDWSDEMKGHAGRAGARSRAAQPPDGGQGRAGRRDAHGHLGQA